MEYLKDCYALAESIVKNRKGSSSLAAMAEGGVVVIALIIVLAIGIAISFPLLEGINRGPGTNPGAANASGWSTTANATFTTFEASVGTAYTIGGMAPLVAFAAIILMGIGSAIYIFRR